MTDILDKAMLDPFTVVVGVDVVVVELIVLSCMHWR